MKKYIILISIIFTSCATINIEQQIVQDFAKEKNLKDIPYANASYLIKEAGSNENVLNIYEQAYINKNLPINEKRIDISPGKIKNWPIGTDEINALKSVDKKANEPYYWSEKKLRLLDIPTIGKEELLSKIHDGTISISSTGHIISKPIMSLNKKYAFLKYSSIFYTGGESEKVYVMEKIHDKWIVILTLFDNYDYNPSN